MAGLVNKYVRKVARWKVSRGNPEDTQGYNFTQNKADNIKSGVFNSKQSACYSQEYNEVLKNILKILKE